MGEEWSDGINRGEMIFTIRNIGDRTIGGHLISVQIDYGNERPPFMDSSMEFPYIATTAGLEWVPDPIPSQSKSEVTLTVATDYWCKIIFKTLTGEIIGYNAIVFGETVMDRMPDVSLDGKVEFKEHCL